MKYTRAFSLAILTVVALSVLVGLAISTPTVHAQAKKGPASDELIYTAVPLRNVPDAIGNTIDAYIFGLRPAQVKAIQGKPGISLYTAPAGIVDFIFNPAPVYTTTLKGIYTREEAAKKLGVNPIDITYIKVNKTAGTTYVELGAYSGKGINPFAFRQIRFAMNYLIDRKYVATNIYGGYAAPMYAPYSYYDPMYSIIADIVAKYRFSYAPALADQIVTKVLTAVGAVKKGGKWYYEGKPITIKFVIRTEDERKELGDMLASELERLGFTVNRMYMSFGEAISTVYFTNPIDFKWHIYTEGWGKGVIDRWDPWALTQFAAPWFGWMPGIQQAGWWQYKNETLDELTKKACLGKFKSKEEFINLMRDATELALQESVRVWIATTMDVYPAVSDLKGVTRDLGAGLRSVFNAREWYIPGKNVVRVGHLHIWTSRTVWNIFGGFSDVYSVDIERQTYDPFIWRHPFNGEPIPFRVTFDVRTAGPTGKLTLPSDAIIWDAKKNEWVNVKSGTKAVSEVVFHLDKLIGTKWHDNVTITWADVLAIWAENFEIAYDPEKSQLESAIASPLRETLDLIKGIKIVPDKKELIVYIDYWHFDKAYIADMASISVINPATLILAQDYLAFTAKKYALSDARSRAQKIPQLSLVLPDHAKAIEDVLKKWLSEGTIPSDYKGYFIVNGKSYLSTDEWKTRLQALIKWIDTYHNAWVSDGPFMLVLFDKDKQTVKLKAFRDPTYPFSPGTWYFGMPKPVHIVTVGVPVVSPGSEATIIVTVSGEPPIHVKYILRDPVTNTIIAAGEATQVSPTSFRIALSAEVTSKLKEYSAYELTILAFSEKVAMPAEVIKTLTTGAALTKKLGEVTSKVAQISKSVEEVSSRVEQLSTRLSQSIEQIRTQLSEKLTKQVSQVSATLGSALKTSLSELSKSMTDLAKTLKSSMSELSSTLKSSVGSVSSQVTAVSNEVKSVKSDVASLKNTMSSLSSSIDELSDKVSSLDKTIKSLAGTFTLLEGLIIITIILEIIAIAVAFRKK